MCPTWANFIKMDAQLDKIVKVKLKVEVNFTLEQATKAHRGSRL
jgi:hypothetical protein